MMTKYRNVDNSADDTGIRLRVHLSENIYIAEIRCEDSEVGKISSPPITSAYGPVQCVHLSNSGSATSNGRRCR